MLDRSFTREFEEVPGTSSTGLNGSLKDPTGESSDSPLPFGSGFDNKDIIGTGKSRDVSNIGRPNPPPEAPPPTILKQSSIDKEEKIYDLGERIKTRRLSAAALIEEGLDVIVPVDGETKEPCGGGLLSPFLLVLQSPEAGDEIHSFRSEDNKGIANTSVNDGTVMSRTRTFVSRETRTNADSATNLGEEEQESIADKLKNFEFTNNLHIMRCIRTVVYLQYIAIISDSPYIRMPLIFQTMCRGFLNYLLYWYSRPFLDFVYCIQYFQQTVEDIWKKYFPTDQAAATIAITRRLDGSDGYHDSFADNNPWRYTDVESRVLSAAIEPTSMPTAGVAKADMTGVFFINYLSDRDWHSVKHFAHYFLTIAFLFLCVSFTISFWEIRDFTDRRNMRSWVKTYVNDGWWRRGGLLWAFSIAKVLAIVAVIAFLMYEISIRFSDRGDVRSLGAIILVIFGAVFGCTVAAFMGFRSTEAAFVRYVSQNVGYTSTIILKRVVKCKVEIGIALMFLIFMPAVYTFAQSLIVIIDWNDTIAIPFRKAVNFHVPCYFLSFPPFRDNTPSSVCGFVGTSLYSQHSYPGDKFYQDRPILQCDTYMGIAFYTFSLILLVFTLVAWLWLFLAFIKLVIVEFRESLYTRPMYAVQNNLDIAQAKYDEDFPLFQRKSRAFRRELWDAILRLIEIFSQMIKFPLHFVKGVVIGIAKPALALLTPILHLSGTIIKLSCNELTVEGRQRAVRQKVKARKEIERKIEAKEILERQIAMKASGKFDALSHKHTGGMEMEGDMGGGRRIEIGVIEDTTEEDLAAASIRSLTEVFEDNLEWFVDGFGCISASLYRFKYCKHVISRAVRKSVVVSYLRLLSGKFRNKQLKLISYIKGDEYIDSPIKPRGKNQGQWRKEMSIEYKERKIQQIQRKLTAELRNVKREFVADHALSITVFDKVIDSGGLFMLICPYRWLCLEWTYALVIEMSMFGILGAITNHNEFSVPTWDSRAMLFAWVVALFAVLTYIYSPYTEDEDGWVDLIGRTMVIFVAWGLTSCEALRADAEAEGGAKAIAIANSGTKIDIYDFSGNLDRIMDEAQHGQYFLIDAGMTFFIYFFVFSIMQQVGVFRMISRKWHGFIYGMHDSILDFLVAKVDERSFGAENVYTGLLLVQQWDEIIESQRRYGLLPWPDVRPHELLDFTDKVFTIKWASAFDLNINNLRSSLGLTLLHTSMCAGDGEACRWLIHKYPDLLNVEDSQRDTPILIALKECAYFLTVYSRLGKGKLDDGTSYSDDDLIEYYPEIKGIRSGIRHDGECWLDYCETYILNAKELVQLKEDSRFDEIQGPARDAAGKPIHIGVGATDTKKGAHTQASGGFALFTNNDENASGAGSPQKKGNKKDANKQPLKKGENILFKNRFPEDYIHDDFETGQMAAWAILMLDVPENNLLLNDYGDDADEDLGNFSQDLRTSVKVSKKVTRVSRKESVPEDHPGVIHLQDFGDDAVLSKAAIANMGIIEKVIYFSRRTFGIKNAESMKENGDKAAMAEREVRWKICKYAEIFLSKEVAGFKYGLQWNLEAYTSINKMANKMQGILCQNLALVCDFNPPDGFARISDWTLGLPEDIYDEIDEDYMEDDHLIPIANAFKTTKQIATKVSAMTGDLHFKFMGKQMNGGQSDKNEFNDRVVQFLAESFVAARRRLNFEDAELGGPARVGFRGIMRALRLQNCSYILPSTLDRKSVV